MGQNVNFCNNPLDKRDEVKIMPKKMAGKFNIHAYNIAPKHKKIDYSSINSKSR